MLERVRSWGPAQQARVLAALEMAEPCDYDRDSPARPFPHATTPHEVALVLRVSTAADRGRLGLARGLVQGFPATLAAATDGTVPWWQARRAVEDTQELTPAARSAVDRDLAANAAKGGSPARFKGRLQAAILAANPAAAEQTHLHALTDRAVWVDPRPDGTVEVAGTLAAEAGGDVPGDRRPAPRHPLSLPPAGWPVEGAHRRPPPLRRPPRPVPSHGRRPRRHRAPRLRGRRPAGSRRPPHQATAGTGAGAGASGGPRAGRRVRRTGQVLVTVCAETLLGVSDAPANLDGHDPSPPATPAASPARATPPGGGCSLTPHRAPSSTSATPGTNPPPRSPSTSSPAPTGNASAPAALDPPPTSTMPTPGPTTAPPRPAT